MQYALMYYSTTDLFLVTLTQVHLIRVVSVPYGNRRSIPDTQISEKLDKFHFHSLLKIFPSPKQAVIQFCNISV